MQRGDIVWVERSRWHASYFLALNRIRETAAEVECFFFFAFRFCVQSVILTQCILPYPADWSVFVYLPCNLLCFTPKPYPSLSAPPYLSPTEMRWGQGIWGEEHREAALHDLKGILMKQHSRAAYSHDNRPQTNSCI